MNTKITFAKTTKEIAQSILLNPSINIKKIVKKQGCMTVHLFQNALGEVLVKKLLTLQVILDFTFQHNYESTKYSHIRRQFAS